MLLHLHIQNYAIIEEIEIEFSEGLQVITGETGAGKSIIAGALSLVLGERADTSILQHRDRKAVVEATFRVHHLKEVEKFLTEEELDREQELVLRREISPNGKSRAFINDTPVNLDQLRYLCSMLVDLHQQFDILSLEEAGFQVPGQRPGDQESAGAENGCAGEPMVVETAYVWTAAKFLPAAGGDSLAVKFQRG